METPPLALTCAPIRFILPPKFYFAPPAANFINPSCARIL
ncbi:hypothetical protein CAMGR0001_0383 [Campylobacter gracilis RM3268]|uniref:Uncharacterized protein n=1 Tax=Campylobacter gracilis RM3268 TaxID=553220 RepID=C8PHD8_9BACT|nr:hypothetical protein CAMGR0001_0383 [Campylobacter gracilis RM3268]